MVFQNDILAGSSGASGTSTAVHTIDQSIRFDDASEHYMYSPAPSSSKSFTTTATISMWIKLGNIGQHYFAGAFYGSNARYDFFQINANNKLQASGRSGGASTATGSGVTKWITTQVFRDPSAWYHLIFVYDTTNAVQSERFRLYVNGERVTEFDTDPSYGASELVYWFGKSSYTTLGAYYNQTGFADYFYWDGYMAEMHGVDGTALNADSFGEFNSSGIWTPKEYTGSHGTDGFYIKGADASALGTNSASNNNTFTLNAISAHDQVLDSPTNNFCTFNSLDNRGSGTLSEGNLKMAFAATNDNVTGTQGISSGKWYWEAHIVDNAYAYIGVQDSGISATGYTASAVALYDGGFIYENNSDTGDRSTTYTNGDVVGVAFDADNKKIWWSKNGQWYSADDSSTTTINISEVEAGNQAQVITRSPDFFMPFYGNYTHSTAIFNFGQEGTFSGNETAGGNSDGNGVGNFFSAVPSGFLALCTKNLGS